MYNSEIKADITNFSLIISLLLLVDSVFIAGSSDFFLYIIFLVGGGSGFVGRELTRLLRGKGHEVTVISRQPGPGKITWVRS